VQLRDSLTKPANAPIVEVLNMQSKEENWLLAEKYQGIASDQFFNDCAKLKAGEPLAYLIGHVPFLNCQIYLDSKPLIPRVETEYWTEKFIKKITDVQEHKNLTILDLCAGSGCIGVAIAKAIPLAQVDFSELEFTHLPTIKKNCQENQIDLARVHIMVSNLFSNIDPKLRYDFIVSNPPYIDPELNRTDLSVMAHEPAIALYGGKAGLNLIKEIILYAPIYLKAKGILWLEHEPEQTEAIHDLASGKFSIITHKDQYGQERFSELVLQ
jgi:release factor glutamine methyltransferase